MPPHDPADPAATLARTVAAILEDNARTRAELLRALDGLPDERRREHWYGGWSLHEVLAHLAAWQDGFAAALELAVRPVRGGPQRAPPRVLGQP